MARRWLWWSILGVLALGAAMIAGSWHNKNWQMPAELHPFERVARSGSSEPVSTGVSTSGWYMMATLNFGVPGQQIAHLAKQNLTPATGWHLTFPEASGYGFNAYKNDPASPGNPTCVVQYYDDSEGGYLTAYNPQIQAPGWRAYIAQLQFDWEIKHGKKIP